MHMNKKAHLSLRFLISNIFIVIGLVLMWRGVWYTLDWVDLTFIGGHHIWTALGGIILGLLVLYVPDHDLKEISKL